MSKANNNIMIYQTKEGSLELKADFASETIWASQKDTTKHGSLGSLNYV